MAIIVAGCKGSKRTVGTRAGVWCVVVGMLAAMVSYGAH